MKFYTNMYFNNLKNVIEFQHQRSKVKVIFKLTKVHQIIFTERQKIVVYNAGFSLSIAWSVPEIFAISLQLSEI